MVYQEFIFLTEGFHIVFSEIFTNKGVGTAILDDEQEKFYTDLLNK